MFRLTNKLAVSNLIKNRKLYYPFALAVLLAVTVTYLFYSLTFNPKIAEIRGGTTIQATLGFGMFVVTLASAIIVLYGHEEPFQGTRNLWHVGLGEASSYQYDL